MNRHANKENLETIIAHSYHKIRNSTYTIPSPTHSHFPRNAPVPRFIVVSRSFVQQGKTRR